MKLIWKEVSYEVLFYSFLMYSIWVLTDLQKKLFVVVPLLTHIWFFCNPMNCNTPGFPVLHYFPEFAQTHTH